MTFIVLRQLGRAAAAFVLCPTARNPNFFTSCNTMLTPVHPALHTLANCTGTNNMLTPTHQAIAANSASIPLGSSQSISRGNSQGSPHRNSQSSSRSKTLSRGTLKVAPPKVSTVSSSSYSCTVPGQHHVVVLLRISSCLQTRQDCLSVILSCGQKTGRFSLRYSYGYVEDETTAPRRGSRHHSRQSVRSPHSRQPPRHPQGDRSERARLRRDHYDARRSPMQPTDDSPESRGTTTCCGAIACSSWTGSRTAHFIPFMACMAFMRSCDWQGKGARLTSQRPRPRHPCLESLSETAHFIAFMAFASLAYQPRPQMLA